MIEEACIKNGLTCSNFLEKCDICIRQSQFLAQKARKHTELRKYKHSSRMGAKFEEKVNDSLNQKLSSSSRLTPNSGAGNIKGDIEILGCINMALELKTKIKPKISRGSLSFTIQKDWLIKLNKESKEQNKEFWALIFSFNESEKDVYAILEEDMLSNMIATMTRDRIKYNSIQKELDQVKNRNSLLETQLAAKEKELEFLKAQLNPQSISNESLLEHKLKNLLETTRQHS